MRWIALVLFSAVVQSCFAQDVSLSGTSPSPTLEDRIAAHFQPLYNEHKQQIFLIFHPGGRATGITVDDVKITQWAGGQATGQGADVQQFIVHYTIYWSSIIHHGDGVTEVDTVYGVEQGQVKVMGNQVIKTNGITKSTVNKEAGSFLVKTLVFHGL